MEVLEREKMRNRGGGSGALSTTSAGNDNGMGGPGGPGGMGKKSSSTSQLSAAGNVDWCTCQSKISVLCSNVHRGKYG